MATQPVQENTQLTQVEEDLFEEFAVPAQPGARWHTMPR
jgi:hypothetical protein